MRWQCDSSRPANRSCQHISLAYSRNRGCVDPRPLRQRKWAHDRTLDNTSIYLSKTRLLALMTGDMTCHSRTYFLSISSYLHLQMLSSKIGEQGSPCSSIFLSVLTEGHCTPRGRVGSIRYVDYHRPLPKFLLSPFINRFLSLT